MAYDFNPLKKRIEETQDWLGSELSSVRTGRATSAILDSITVPVYGAQSPIAHIASISTSDSRTLVITPWDKGQLKDIEKAIVAANLGLSVSAAESGLRVSFPELTSERRVALGKVVKGKLEEARISLRKARDETWNEIQDAEKEGRVSEDEKFRFKNDMQKLVDDASAALESLAEKKEREIAS